MREGVAFVAFVAVMAGCGDGSGRETDSGSSGGSAASLASTGDDSAGSESDTADTTAGSGSDSQTTDGSSGATDMTDPTGSSDPSAVTDPTDATDPTATEPTDATDPTTTTTTTTTDPTGNTGVPSECQQVDFVFAIDNSVSMEGEQAALKAAFPAFMDTIMSELPTDDYHIMVVDTDAETRCTQSACAGNPHQTCNAYACMDIFDTCDMTRGAGVVHPAGVEASNKFCQLYGGNRYIIQGEPDLVGTFSCIATVGTAGDPSERPMDGLVEAVSPALNGPGGCNLDFLRDDAILVLTFISDDPNVEDQNSAQQAYDAIVAAKGGDADRIVVLGLIIGEDVGCPAANKPDAGKHWSEFISLFGERGVMGPICTQDYNQFFLDAVSIIDETCMLNPPE